ncbi:hypothetical protein [uncultured Tateyamaria sp.]|uniref:hypothetical protein n=1 Tax=uncultured Tateyamaria sp. TaxID=455651 RepID=UPI002632508F|nr:hypothetical protein [uncultured Tateyamaria sp.]
MRSALAILAVAAGLAGPAAAQNRNTTFWFSLSDNFAIGNARASAFTDGDVRSALAAICPGKAISGFTTSVDSSGDRTFSALCSAGYTMRTGTVYVDRTSTGSLRIEPQR